MKHTTLIPSLIPSLILATLASTALLAHAQYAAYDLGNFAAYGVNSAGTIVVRADTSGSGSYAFSYSNGHMTDLGIPGTAYGINNSGTIVGVNGANHAFSYSGGVTTDHITVADTPQSSPVSHRRTLPAQAQPFLETVRFRQSRLVKVQPSVSPRYAVIGNEDSLCSLRPVVAVCRGHPPPALALTPTVRGG